jgi:hypothetical protein
MVYSLGLLHATKNQRSPIPRNEAVARALFEPIRVVS